MKYEQECKAILPLVGGRDNIINCYNCMTRLRFVLKDLDKADLEGLKKVNGVLGVKLVGEQVQCIVGQKAGAMCAEFCAFAVRALTKEDRTIGISSFVSIFMGGVIEPTIFGIAFPHKPYLAAILLANGVAGCFAGLMHVGSYALSSSNILGLLSFSGGPTQNLVFGLIAAFISFACGFGLAMFFDITAGKKAAAKA